MQFLQITIEQHLSLKSIFLKILTKNLVSWLDGFKDEKISYYRGSLENPIFREVGFTKKLYIGENCLKRGKGLESLQI